MKHERAQQHQIIDVQNSYDASVQDCRVSETWDIKIMEELEEGVSSQIDQPTKQANYIFLNREPQLSGCCFFQAAKRKRLITVLRRGARGIPGVSF